MPECSTRAKRAGISTFLVLGMLLLGACAAQMADPSKLASVHQIALTGFADPQYKLMIGLTDAPPPLFSSRESFEQQMAEQNLHLGADVKDAVRAELTKIGYVVQPSKTETTDAVLNVDIMAAIYGAEPILLGGKCKPAALIDVRLTDARSGTSLFAARYSYQDTEGTGLTGHIALVADPKYTFDDTDALYANPSLAAEGLRQIAPALAQDLAKRLAKQ